MFYTIVTWSSDNEWEAVLTAPSPEQKQAAAEMTNVLAPDFESELIVAVSADRKTRMAMKSWPSEEVAQSWIDYTMANFNGVTSAVVTSTPADFSDYQIHTQKII
jgi:hypothetical protein